MSERMKKSKIPMCQDCPEVEAEYFWKDGRDYIPVCEDCAKTWALEDKDDIVKIEDLEDGEIMDYVK